MNVYYLLAENGERFFYYDESEEKGDGSRTPATGLRGWAERKFREMRDAKDDPNGGLTRWAGRLWDWLHSFGYPDEAMFARFGSARTVELRYPVSRSLEDVQEAWTRFLKRRGRRHLFWGAIDAALAPPGLLLAILPGPNVIGYWFVYRACVHLLAWWRIRRVLKGTIPTRWTAVEALDEPIASDERGEPRHPSLAGGAKLGAYLKRLRRGGHSGMEEVRRESPHSRDSIATTSFKPSADGPNHSPETPEIHAPSQL